MKDFKVYLTHIADEIEFIQTNTSSLKKEDFINDPIICRAVLRSLEVIGEAVKNIPEEFRNRYPSVIWKEFAGLRDILIHKYFGVDYDMVWDVIMEEIPGLKVSIERII